MAQSRDLEALLRRCTVRVEQGQGHGTGFFVAPGLVVTCAHVVETTDSQTTPVPIYWQGQTYRAHIEKIFASPYPDLALLRTELQEHPCVYLHTAITLDDPLYSFSYPDN
jgi:S1-C subfamily serine protease